MEHTKGQWEISHHNDNDELVIRDEDDGIIANLEADCCRGNDETQANAAFICKAVNCHQQLLDACKDAVQWFDDECFGTENKPLPRFIYNMKVRIAAAK